ncbi:MAG: von Willebrand factor type A domain-containing protein [Sediminibacterium sp.]
MKRKLFFSFLLLVMATAFTYATRIITGTIVDDAGKPVIAQIHVKNSKKEVSSAADGSFSITLDAQEKVILVISAPGYQQQEVTVQKDNKVILHLKVMETTLQDVVVTGYPTGMKKDLSAPYVVANSKTFMSNMPLRGAELAVGTISSSRLPKESNYGRDHRLNGSVISAEREGYDPITENLFLSVKDNPLSTFSIDVDAASYSNIRRILKSGKLPTEGAVRIEEMINYFNYEYAQPIGKDPFAVHTELAVCPWNTQHQLVLIGLQGKKIDEAKLPPSNLTFLIDVSGSMMTADRLPLVQASLKLLVDQLRSQDKVAIVVYAGNAGLVLPATEGDRKIAIKEAIDRLEAGGSTAGGAGIQLAYKVAKENFNKEGNNRVILCTDGDFNVGLSSDDALEKLIEEERKSGVYLTVLGYGTGNYQDAKMQKLADKGNGNHAYIDGLSEAKKVLINEFGGTLFTIAKDVKLQVEFNPSKVAGYRLIGYENRMLAKEDFNDDKKDAGELGSGHTVTALYELIPVGGNITGITAVDPLRYQKIVNAIPVNSTYTDEVMMVKLRYKQPDGEQSSLLSYAVKNKPASIGNATENLRFAASVASFGMLLRHSEYKGDADFRFVRSLAKKSMGYDREGYRKEFLELVDLAENISKGKETAQRWEER